MNEVSKNLMCVVIRNGVEIWLEGDRAQRLKVLLSNGGTQFVEYEGEMINRADIVGVFKALTMEDLTRRKNGQWRGAKGGWHDRGDTVCSCGNILPRGIKCGYCN
jgi:hypothetical protein